MGWTMRLTSVIICFAFQAVASSGKWWEHTTLYQIYPRSFQDSNDDGTGDLAGITSRLDYLVDIGVEAFWLSPIYASPMADFGYDVSNYTDVDQIFGTIEDFDNLSKEAKKRGLKIVMDFIPNHSSNKSEWFIKSENTEEPYTDYYIWRDRNESNPGGVPNNWLSVFRFSAWTWSEKRQQFYYHAFLPGQTEGWMDLGWMLFLFCLRINNSEMSLFQEKLMIQMIMDTWITFTLGTFLRLLMFWQILPSLSGTIQMELDL